MKAVRIVLLAVFSCLVLFHNGYAAEGTVKVGILDLSKAFDGYGKTKEADKVLETESKKYEDERNAKIDKIKELQGKLALLKEEEKEKSQKEFEDLRADLLAFDQSKRADLGKQRDATIREILLEIEKIVSDYAKKNSYDLILNDRVLIYGNEAFDVTEDILKLLNESYNKKE